MVLEKTQHYFYGVKLFILLIISKKAVFEFFPK